MVEKEDIVETMIPILDVRLGNLSRELARLESKIGTGSVYLLRDWYNRLDDYWRNLQFSIHRIVKYDTAAAKAVVQKYKDLESRFKRVKELLEF